MDLEEKVLANLVELISPGKVELINRIAKERTNHIVVVLEDINKEHNASAVIRTCDCFGIQNLEVIEKNQEFNKIFLFL